MGVAEPIVTPALVMRTSGSRAAAVAVWVAEVIGLVAILRTDRGAGLVLGLSLCAAIALGMWVGAWRPCVQVDDDAVTLQNIVRDIRVPWDRMTAVTAGWSLVLEADEHHYTAWAVTGQAPRNTVLRRREGFLFGGAGRMGGLDGFEGATKEREPGWKDRGQSATRAAATHIHNRWRARREVSTGEPVTVTSHWAPLLGLLGLVAVAVVSYLAL